MLRPREECTRGVPEGRNASTELHESRLVIQQALARHNIEEKLTEAR
jgi:hypothetical protein